VLTSRGLKPPVISIHPPPLQHHNIKHCQNYSSNWSQFLLLTIDNHPTVSSHSRFPLTLCLLLAPSLSPLLSHYLSPFSCPFSPPVLSLALALCSTSISIMNFLLPPAPSSLPPFLSLSLSLSLYVSTYMRFPESRYVGWRSVYRYCRVAEMNLAPPVCITSCHSPSN
jgi:hypothetical protein